MSALRIFRNFIITLSVFLCIASPALAAPFDTDKPVGQRDDTGASLSLSLSAPVASLLQVTGTTNNFTISAHHADVLSVLKLVFDQAHRQFVADASVTGDVTLSISNQRFDAVLAFIGQQVLLKYQVNKDGVYQVRRDNEALARLIVQTQAINNLLADQLRRMGYAAPALRGNGLRSSAGGANSGLGLDRNASALGLVPGSAKNQPDAAHGENRGLKTKDLSKAVNEGSDELSTRSATSQSPADVPQRSLSTGSPNSRSLGGFGGGVIPGAAPSRKGEAMHLPQGTDVNIGEKASRDKNGGSAFKSAAGSPGNGFGGGGSPLSDSDRLLEYDEFLRQNQLVSINTKGQEIPVRDLLQDVARQAGYPVFIDPSVPSGKDFVLSGYITPRSYSDLLTVLCYKAQLDWRLINGRIFITATPQFKLRLNNAILVPQSPGIIILPNSRSATSKSNGNSDTKVTNKSNPDK